MPQLAYTEQSKVNSYPLLSGEKTEFFLGALPILYHSRIASVLACPPSNDLLCELRYMRLTVLKLEVRENTYLRSRPLTLKRHFEKSEDLHSNTSDTISSKASVAVERLQ